MHTADTEVTARSRRARSQGHSADQVRPFHFLHRQRGQGVCLELGLSQIIEQ